MNLKVYQNGDDALIVWKPNKRIPACRGFALYRRRNGKDEIVKTWVGFEGDSSQPGERRPSTEWPIQKFIWVDYMANPGDTVQYKVVPVLKNNGNITPDEGQASEWSPQITLDAQTGNSLSAFFNRGIVAAQWVSRRLGLDSATAKQDELSRAIETVNDPIRNYLAGPLRGKLVSLLEDAAKNNQQIFAALFELDDPELKTLLRNFKKNAHVVLANGSAKKKGDDLNAQAREELADIIDIYDRMAAPRSLAHNKFLVICDKNGEPLKVWTGSTNWSETGLCTQANNGLLIEDAKVAAAYKAQWESLKKAGDASPDWLVTANSEKRQFKLVKAPVTVWFTPTADYEDLEYARELINSANRGILFLMFNPGPKDTLLNTIIDRTKADSDTYNADLYVHGVLNQDPSTKLNPVNLFHRGRLDKADFDVVLPEAIDERLSFWVEEIKKKTGTFAMVHSKVIIIDPFGKHPVVITGSHNLGPKASHTNDENLVIIKDDPILASAYATNIMSIYSQYRWRFFRKRSEKSAKWMGLQDNDRWQDDYLQGAKLREINFWLGK